MIILAQIKNMKSFGFLFEIFGDNIRGKMDNLFEYLIEFQNI